MNKEKMIVYAFFVYLLAVVAMMMVTVMVDDLISKGIVVLAMYTLAAKMTDGIYNGKD